MTLPVTPLTLPHDLEGQQNGQIDPALLVLFGMGNFKLHHLAARAMRAMLAASGYAAGTTGTYRTYLQQVALFKERYTTIVQPGQPSKVWNGVTYWKKPGVATAAVPGTSNHGLGLAIDFATNTPGYLNFVNWLINNAITYGYSAETQSENWHWRYVAGDNIPPAVLKFEKTYTLVYVEDNMQLVVPNQRVYDSRNTESLHSNQIRTIQVAAPTAVGVGVNLTVVPTGTGGFLKAFGTADPPETSNVNFFKDIVANYAVVQCTGGAINLLSNVDCHVIVDLQAIW